MTDQEISRIIAEKVMGWTLEHGWWKDDNGYTAYEAHSDGTLEECDGDWWHPSTDIGQAFQVVEKTMGNPRMQFDCLAPFLCNDHKYRWKCTYYDGKTMYEAVEDTPAMAICKAALKAMEA